MLILLDTVAYLYINICIYMYISHITNIYVYVHTCTCIYILSVYTYKYINESVYIYIYLYIYIYCAAYCPLKARLHPHANTESQRMGRGGWTKVIALADSQHKLNGQQATYIYINEISSGGPTTSPTFETPKGSRYLLTP